MHTCECPDTNDLILGKCVKSKFILKTSFTKRCQQKAVAQGVVMKMFSSCFCYEWEWVTHTSRLTQLFDETVASILISVWSQSSPPLPTQILSRVLSFYTCHRCWIKSARDSLSWQSQSVWLHWPMGVEQRSRPWIVQDRLQVWQFPFLGLIPTGTSLFAQTSYVGGIPQGTQTFEDCMQICL